MPVVAPSFRIRNAILAAGLCAVAAGAQTRLVGEPLLLDARGEGATWRYATDIPAFGWTEAGFDDAGWPEGKGGFGTPDTRGSRMSTGWVSQEIYLRTRFTVAKGKYEGLLLSIHHDDEAEVYLNGHLIHQESGALGAYEQRYLSDEALSKLQEGENVIAVHCVNSGGGPQYIDVGLSGLRTVRVTTLSSDAREGEAEWKFTVDNPGAGWEEGAFDDAAWLTGRGGFGTTEMFTGTSWTTDDIWLRRSFENDRVFNGAILSFRNDDDMEVYLNGVRILGRNCCVNDYEEVPLTKEQAALIVKGTNVLAVHCANTGAGPQHVDVGLVGWEIEDPVAIGKRTARAGSGIRKPEAVSGVDALGRLQSLLPAKRKSFDLPVAKSGRLISTPPDPQIRFPAP